MELLRWFEQIRTPFFDSAFSLVTRLGEETLIVVAGLLFFWCISKKQGYYLLAVGFVGTVLNQFLKIACRIPRPWVKDSSFTIVESARAEATGYSFPSGHTQNAVGIFGGIARANKNTVLRILCVIAAVLVAVSRMYLGVHTPADVGVALVMAAALVFVLYPLVGRALESKKGTRLFFLVMTALALVYVLYAALWPFPADADAENIAHGVENGYKILGCLVGLFLAYEIDERWIHFDTKAVWWAQVLKLVLGLIPLLAIQAGLKQPLLSLFGGNAAAHAVRYFLMVLYAGGAWPLTFRFFGKLGRKNG
ncbi:MAG: phosphatase PAP2 family protein [Ruminococcaceae bacterium]|nr:phosphatase PAP2 family protein [Oscillospiraceae bacterium]